MGMLRVLADSGGQGHRILVGSRLFGEPWSLPNLTALRDFCHRFFRLKSMIFGSQYTSQFLTLLHFLGSEVFRLICASFYDPLVVKES